MAQSLIILGTGGNALDILDLVEAINRVAETWTVAGFLDDSRAVGSLFEGYEILGGVRDAARQTGSLFLNAIGTDRSYRKRPDIVAQTKLDPSRFATLVHPLAAVSSRAALGTGVCANAGVVVGGRASVGSHVWLGAGSVIGNNVTIAEYAMVSARVVVGASAQVGPTAYIGAGACIRQRVTVGERALVGLGGVVIADVAPGTTVVGNPARIMVRTPKGKSSDTPLPQPGLPDPSAPRGGTQPSDE